MTWKVDEYDAGKYILIDSPGIDAPQEHEVIADSQINACHIILFVMSSEGGFAQGKNYAKMLDLINRRLPFIIVINDWAVTDDELEEHLSDLNKIKRKIIENLKEQCSIQGISSNDIQDKFDVIVLNALDAWEGVRRHNENIIAESHISDLTDRINQRLEGKEAFQNLLAPLSALERKIADGEKILTAKTAGEDYAQKRETLQMKISHFAQSFQENLRSSAERHFDEIYQGYLGSHIDMGRIYNDICSDAEDAYKRASAPIIEYIRTNFQALNITVDNNGRVTLNTPQEEISSTGAHHDDYGDDSKDYIDFDSPSNEASNSHAGAALGALLGGTIGSIIPGIGTLIGTGGGAVIGEVLKEVVDWLLGREKHAREEYERMRRESEAYNRREERRAEEEQRRKQSARMAATNQTNAIIRELRTLYGDVIDRNFNAVMHLIDEAIARISRGNAKVRNTIAKMEDLRKRIQDLRRNITC